MKLKLSEMMKLSEAIDLFIADKNAEGRINSPRTEVSYRATLGRHAEDVENRDPRLTTRGDVKRTLARWPNPNTRRTNRSILVSFYDWCMQELEPGRIDNPAKQTRPPKVRKPQVYRMTRGEVVAFLTSSQTLRERRVSHLGVCAGIRNAELRGLQRRHFERAGWIHVSADIAKGGRERWVPVLPELEPVIEEILRNVGPTTRDENGRWVGEYVLPAERWRDPGSNTTRIELKLRPASRQVLRTVVMELGRRAGIHAHITPHSMRHAFGDHIARTAGIKNAQALLGHADVGTTQTYTGAPTLDELAAAIDGFRFDENHKESPEFGSRRRPESNRCTSRLDPQSQKADADAFLRRLLGRLQPTIEVYADAFGGGPR